jgi:DNA-3-methyladenine glycosylase I
MEKQKTYCEAVSNLDSTNVHRIYHDTAYGFPINNDNELFKRLILEINQAGLSWTTILNKQENFDKAFNNFNISEVALFNDLDRERLLKDTGIIRNRLKIEATIHNAKVILKLQSEFGSFKNWLDSLNPKSKEDWVKVFKKTFKFTGGEIVNEFLMSTGYLKGAHIETCCIYKPVEEAKPAWLLTQE